MIDGTYITTLFLKSVSSILNFSPTQADMEWKKKETQEEYLILFGEMWKVKLLQAASGLILLQ